MQELPVIWREYAGAEKRGLFFLPAMHVSLIVAIEGVFSIRFDAAEIAGLANVSALVAVIERKL